MEFDESRVYGSINANELKVGSTVILADTLMELKYNITNNLMIDTLSEIRDESYQHRFGDSNNVWWGLAYLVSEPDEKKLRWTDLKVGDVITNKKTTSMVVRIDMDNVTHILAGNVWLNDEELKEWEKVENEKMF